jgi:hypothetical protein
MTSCRNSSRPTTLSTRWILVLLLQSTLVVATQASTASRKQTTDLPRISDANDSYKQSKDWWKDPLAQFNDEDVEEDQQTFTTGITIDNNHQRTSPVIEAIEHTENDEKDEAFVFMSPNFDDTSDDIFSLPEPPQSSDEMVEETETITMPPVSKPSLFQRHLKAPIQLEIPETTTPMIKPEKNHQLTIAAPERQHSQVSTQSSSFDSISPAALLLALQPVRSFLTKVPAVQGLAAILIGKHVLQWSVHVTKVARAKWQHQQAFKKQQKQREAVQKERNKAAQQRQQRRATEDDVAEALSESDEEQGSDGTIWGATPLQPKVAPDTQPSKILGGSHVHQAALSPWWKSAFGNLSPLARPRRIQQQLDDLQIKYNQLELAKQTTRHDYETATLALQEATTELSTLKMSAKYLQAQLHDNEELLAQTVKTERRKAKEEFNRMKQAMVKVVERERESMRDEFVKQASELEALWKREMKRVRSHQALDNDDGLENTADD